MSEVVVHLIPQHRFRLAMARWLHQYGRVEWSRRRDLGAIQARVTLSEKESRFRQRIKADLGSVSFHPENVYYPELATALKDDIGGTA